MYKINGCSQHTIVIVMANRCLLARLYCILVKAAALSLNIEVSYTKLVTLLLQFSCLLQIESMHDRANCRPRLCVAMFGRTCLDASALWCAGVQKLPGCLPYVTVRI